MIAELPLLATIGLAWATLAAETAPLNPLTDQEKQAGWRLLFDGKTTDGWRGYKMDRMPPGWKVIDGALVRVTGGSGGKGAGGGDDIITTGQFDNFELRLEWRLHDRGGNSGIILRASEDAVTSWHTGPEMQVLDNAAYPGRDVRQLAGACYDLYAPSKDTSRPLGQWNAVRIVAHGNHVEHWLNGEKIVAYELGSDDWNRRVAASKFKNKKWFLEPPKKGHLCLQDHTSRIEYRNIKLRPITEQQGRPSAAAPAGYRVQLDTISSGFDKKTCWVHARAGAISASPPRVVLTMQKLLLSGSDVFFALNEMRSDDMGKTWSGPVEHAQTLGRREEPEGVVVAPCDFWPKWHAKTGKLLGIGHTARYRNDKIIGATHRQTCYSVYDEATRAWTPWTTLKMPDGEKFFNAGAGSVQRLDLPNGDILLPIYFRPRGERFSKVTVLRCKFDGRTLSFAEQGNDLAIDTNRGLAEPSLTSFRDCFYLTLRHDKAGYVSTSADGLHFDAPRQWLWDDGSELGNYNTQQHWVTHQSALYLVYTRRGANNDHVFRHRAPLFMAQVDPERLCVMRSTETILVPNRGARLGNFGVTAVDEHQTWVTVTEWMQTVGPNPYDYTVPMRYGADNAVFVARVVWERPNTGWDRR